MKFRLLFSLLTLWVTALPAQVSMSSGLLNFFSVYTDQPESLTVSVTNNTARTLDIERVGLYHGDAFQVDNSPFTVSPGGSHTLTIYCSPTHNLDYMDMLYLESGSHADPMQVLLFANCRYPDTYYDATQDLSHEDLKTALKALLGFGVTQLSYNNARDEMFMNVDNQAVNGQGASQNTLECVYTGQQAVGYTSRADAQTNYNFNTEHTMPQSLFGSALPMQSDLHHLFPTTDASNSERGNNPFGVVSSPTWSSGGSLSNGSVFEPRDAHKGDAARALLYMVIRYQDFSNFVAPQESILRQWAQTFAPDAVDSTRNEDIFSLQGNRNPFIDHPEFFDRIASICGTDNGPTDPAAHYLTDTLFFGSVGTGDTLEGGFCISSQGYATLDLSSITVTGTGFDMPGATSLSIPVDTGKVIPVRFFPDQGLQDFSGLLTFSTNDPSAPTVSVVLIGDSYPVGRTEPEADIRLEAWPVPADDRLFVRAGTEMHGATVELCDIQGRSLLRGQLDQHGNISLNTSPLTAGIYVLTVRENGRSARRLVQIR